MIFLIDVGTGQPIRKFRGHISVSWLVAGGIGIESVELVSSN